MENNEKLQREACIDKKMENLLRKPFLTDKRKEEYCGRESCHTMKTR